MQNAVNFYSKVTANIHKKAENYREASFFLSMDSVIFANNSSATAAIRRMYLGFSHLHSFLSSIFGFGLAGILLTKYCPDPALFETREAWEAASGNAHYIWYYFAAIPSSPFGACKEKYSR